MRFSREMPTHRFTLDDVYQMVDAGILAPDAPVELCDGALIVVPQSSPRKSYITMKLRLLLAPHYGQGHIREEKSVQLDDYSAPEPNLSVTHRNPLTFRDAHPTGPDCRLVVQVSDVTQFLDHRKATLYSQGGVPEYWLLDIEDRTVSVYKEPVATGHSVTTVYGENGAIPLPGLDATLSIGKILAR